MHIQRKPIALGPGAFGAAEILYLVSIPWCRQSSTQIAAGPVVTELDFAQKPTDFLMIFKKSLRIHG